MRRMRKYKYNAIKTKIGDIVFDSRLEASFYAPILKFCNANNLSLELQKKMEIYENLGKKYFYIADFFISSKGKECIVDAKGVKIELGMLKIRLASTKYNTGVYVGKSMRECLKYLKDYFKID